ncbi:MFS transporter [Lichenifustis flavocetrariae]|uniref:MFS transporter n=1 Tax=Lichenifustis flavocetrariae TaxID=2949735 RepID=A0AA41Z9Q3_9HYPH|nr:MFS transporter [Lichenifustis flavocetrariae]MCW6511877.1 MFS transporter [Lichenifustis flavocetrariae]
MAGERGTRTVVPRFTLIAASGGDIHLVFWIAVIPALLAVAVLVVAVREPARPASPATTARSPIHPSELMRLGPTYWRLVTVGTVLTLARFSEAFLILRAQDLGLVATLVPLVLVVMNVVYGLVAYPMGILADRKDPKLLLCAGFGVLVAADVILAFAPNLWVGVFGVALWGLHMGMTQGLLASLVSAAVPADRRGTAFGVYNLAGGVALLLASVLAGALWQSYGPGSTFMVGAAFTMVGLIGAVTLLRRDP